MYVYPRLWYLILPEHGRKAYIYWISFIKHLHAFVYCYLYFIYKRLCVTVAVKRACAVALTRASCLCLRCRITNLHHLSISVQPTETLQFCLLNILTNVYIQIKCLFTKQRNLYIHKSFMFMEKWSVSHNTFRWYFPNP